ncbi:uncharacterized protein PV07_08090 [Cladophialophora immunda]|uniref:Uncharacterized protein n=1 Tax=Cladophialophora immunda TaxID=569365 RepID=A0A0D2CBI8_9EURO|nr:uncharacterized protein PV07_08090 [Cladophialophora immunda]KIW28423.1 hypothetical protein PV07_08090 [Cladophialophora immunda]
MPASEWLSGLWAPGRQAVTCRTNRASPRPSAADNVYKKGREGTQAGVSLSLSHTAFFTNPCALSLQESLSFIYHNKKSTTPNNGSDENKMVRLRLTNNQTGHGENAEIPLLNHQQPIREFYALDSSGKLMINAAELTADFQGVEVVVTAGGQSVVLTTNQTYRQFTGLVDAANGSILARKA